MIAIPFASAGDNPFGMTQLSSGYMVAGKEGKWRVRSDSNDEESETRRCTNRPSRTHGTWLARHLLALSNKEVHYEFGTFVNQTRGVIDAFTIGADGYSSATFADQVLPVSYGFPMKLRSPPKLGFKNPKHIMAIYATSTYPGGYWEDQGYNWFSGS